MEANKSISSGLASGAEEGFKIEICTGRLELATVGLSGSFRITLSTELTLCESLEASFEVLLSNSLFKNIKCKAISGTQHQK